MPKMEIGQNETYLFLEIPLIRIYNAHYDIAISNCVKLIHIIFKTTLVKFCE